MTEHNKWLVKDAAEYGIEGAKAAVPQILGMMADGRNWNAFDLWWWMPTRVSCIHTVIALQALVKTGTIVGAAPYDVEPQGDMSELVYRLPEPMPHTAYEEWCEEEREWLMTGTDMCWDTAPVMEIWLEEPFLCTVCRMVKAADGYSKCDGCITAHTDPYEDGPDAGDV